MKQLAEIINSSSNILADLDVIETKLKSEFDCEEFTLFGLDRSSRQLYSVSLNSSNKIEEIRLDISPKSLAGFVAATGKPLNIKDAYSKNELSGYHRDLVFDSWWDKELNFKTKSILVVPLPHNKKLIGVAEIINKKSGGEFSDAELRKAREYSPLLAQVLLKLELETLAKKKEGSLSGEDTESKVHKISQTIHSAQHVDEILIELKDDILGVFDATVVTLYAVDIGKNEIYSKIKTGESVNEIRVPISSKSIAGCVALTGKQANITDVYDADELRKFHEELAFDSSWDKKSGFKTKSMLVQPLFFKNRLMGVMQLVNKKTSSRFTAVDDKYGNMLGEILALAFNNMYRDEKIRGINTSIHSAKNIDEILIDLQQSILELFDAERITIYAVDQAKNEIFSKVKSGTVINEIRVPISPESIAGCAATLQKPLNIKNVYDENHLKSFHPDMKFDNSWDKKSGFKTKSMLVQPLVFQNKLMGILQLVNKKGQDRFDYLDDKNGIIIGETLALAFHNQLKFVEQKPTKFSHLVNENILTEEELTSATVKARKSKQDVETILINDHAIEKSDIGKSLENFYGVPFFAYDDSIILPGAVFAGLNKNFMIKNHWTPLERTESKAVVLTDNPRDETKNDNLKLIFPKKEIELRVGLKEDIARFLETSSEPQPGDEEVSGAAVSSVLGDLEKERKVSEEEDPTAQKPQVEEAIEAFSENDSAIVKLVNTILTDAYDEGVSDIHIEPGIAKDSLLVRFRKDGACRVYEEIPYLYKQAFLSRIKIMSKLDIAEKRLPQDGKIKMKYGNKEVEFRVATCPTVGGNEDAVLRILAASKPLPLDVMNFSPRNLGLVQETVVKPYGLILVVGPTGSGKTTTLHSCLGYINKPDKKIWTAEDPVEITQKGLRQVQMANKIGLDFARAMRSFLRGDPDVIMVDEMRDGETCAIGLEASLTGHLVFSTLHTNSAPETITRLLDMGMNPLNFADALLMILAQRLVRTLCKKCKEPYRPDQEEFDRLVNHYGKEQFPGLGIEYNDDLQLMKPVGCEKCNNTGYAGRTGLHEILEGTEDIKRMIMQKKLVEELRAQAISDGMTTLKQDGIWKVFKGDCDLKQVLNVCIQ